MKHEMPVAAAARRGAPHRCVSHEAAARIPGSNRRKTPGVDVGCSWDLGTILALGYDHGFVAETGDVPSLPDKWHDSKAKFLVSRDMIPSSSEWGCSEQFFLLPLQGCEKERSVDNGEPVKPHLDWLSFSPTSFPHSMPACWLGNAGQGLPAFPFSAGEDFPLQRLSSGPGTSGGHAWGNGWETPKQLKTISGGDLSLLVSWKWWWGGLRMQGITWFVVLSKSIKPHGWDLTIYHILVHLISNGNEK